MGELLRVKGLHKKFAKDIRLNLKYGFLDLTNNLFKRKTDYLKLRRKEFWALSDINFKIEEGEILGIIGSNGSGKTTLMRIIANIYPSDIGSIELKEHIRIIPIFAVKAGLHPLFTGLENVYIKGAMFGMTKNEIDYSISFVKEFSELGNMINSPIGNYSSGMKARLAFSIALAAKPDLFIIDEALAVGDSLFKTKCYEYLKSYVGSSNKGIIFVSNNVKKVLKIATRLIVMDKGEIVHRTTDIKEGIIYYLDHCLQNLDDSKRREYLNTVLEYEL